jgi:hypothetical protein
MSVDVVELGGGIDVLVLARSIEAVPAAGIDVVLGAGGPMGPPGPSGGAVIAKIAARALGGHRVVKIGAGGEADYPDNSLHADGELILGVTTGAVSNGAAVTIQAGGELIESSWSWSLGPVFCGAAGVLTQSPPGAAAWLRQIGVATAPDRLLVDLQPTFILA